MRPPGFQNLSGTLPMKNTPPAIHTNTEHPIEQNAISRISGDVLVIAVIRTGSVGTVEEINGYIMPQ
jgi:NAD(P)H-dependent flavin oxidoreductase YrpB (nitropropane dioxygenase family)